MAFEAQIARLSDQQAIAVVNALAGEFAEDETPEGREEQSAALAELLAREGVVVDVSGAADSDPAQAAAARELLALMGEAPEIEPLLQDWLESPPTQEQAALPLILAAPIVLTGCIVLLQVAGHTRFKRSRDGRWEVEYDPSKRTPFYCTTRELVGTLAGLMGKMAGAG